MPTESNHHRINYIEFPVTDITRSKQFYGSVFEWTFEDFGDTYTSFSDGNLDGGFRKEATVESSGPLVVLYSENLEASQEMVESGGGTISMPVFSFPGGRRFHFKDPSGNELAIWSDK